MNIGPILHQIAYDSQLQAMLVAVALDLVLGVLAAAKLGTFRLAYLTNFLRNDVLGKVVPWMVLVATAIVAGSTKIIIPQVDLTNIAHGIFVGIMAAMAGSIVSSLRDLGLPGVPTMLGSAREIPAAQP